MSEITKTFTDHDGTETSVDIGPVPQLVLAFGPGGMRPMRRPLVRGSVDVGRGASPLGLGPLDDGRMSRNHARFERRRATWWVTDLGSRNGTAVDGERISGPTPLRDGSVVRTGDTLWVLRVAPNARRSEVRGDPDHPLEGISPEIEMLRTDLAVLAPREISVLILGETGTGKEVVARALHHLSGRTGPFVAQNCAAVPAELLESTLFGHKKGAFTGADTDRRGLLQEADGGTLFLDELGEMSLALQAKLLRVLETRKVRRVGAMLSEALDLRVVSATHRDLASAVRRKEFRLDLYGRLAPWTINLSPLRNRPEDVPTLAARFTARAMETSFVEALMLHPWPLNVRGLRAAIERAEVRPSGPLKLDRRVRAALDDAMALVVDDTPTEDAPSTETDPIGPRQPPDEAALRSALTANQGRVAAVAREFDASRQQVYRWMKRYDLSIEEFR